MLRPLVPLRSVRVHVHVPEPVGDRRGVRLPPGADSALFSGWGVRF